MVCFAPLSILMEKNQNFTRLINGVSNPLAVKGWGKVLAFIILISTWQLVSIATYLLDGLPIIGFGGFVLLCLVAALLMGYGSAQFFFFLSLFTGIFFFIAERMGLNANFGLPDHSIAIWIGHGTIYITVMVTSSIIFNHLKTALIDVKIKEINDHKRTNQLQVASEIARDATSIREVDRLLSHAASLISQRFGYYHSAIFLVDERVNMQF